VQKLEIFLVQKDEICAKKNKLKMIDRYLENSKKKQNGGQAC